MVLVTSCHLGLLTLLRPVLFYRDTTPVVRNKSQVLELRFFQAPQPSSLRTALAAHRLIAPVMHGRKTPSTRLSEPPAVRHAAPTDRADPPPHGTRSTRAANPDTGAKNALDDGGFRERLQHAQRSYSVHGVPGSEAPVAPGIHLVDPMSQGIAAAVRTAQRAFGIENSHCIDVDVWRHLTPQDLSARYISPSDVDKTDQKYDCNRPPGLSF